MRRAIAAVLAVAACDPANAEPRAQTAAAAAPTIEIDLSPQACGVCHGDALRQWSGSLHARAWVDPIFQREYATGPAAGCRDCHAPPSSAPGRTTGVDCATCHVRDGRVLATHASAAGERAHPMRVDPTLRTPLHCASCHQFAFLPDGAHDPREALQNTLGEFLTSDAAREGETCQSCHMRELGAVSHRFPGIEDPALLARAVHVEVEAARERNTLVVDVRITGGDIGHMFPTGDVFRSARLTITTPAGAREAFSLQRWLGDTISADGEALFISTIDDTRVPAPGTGELRERLTLPDDGADAITWELRLHRVAPGIDPAEVDDVATSHEVARGRVALAPGVRRRR